MADVSEECSGFNNPCEYASPTMGTTASQDAPTPSSLHRQTKRKQRKRRTELDPGDDGYRWHKYGQKTLMDTTFVRGYYRCAQKGTGCQAKKMVDNHASGNVTLRVTYDGQHNHPMPQFSRELVVASNRDSNRDWNPQTIARLPAHLPVDCGLTRHSSGVSTITTVDHESDEEAAKQKQAKSCRSINLNYSPLTLGGVVGNADSDVGALERPLHPRHGSNPIDISLSRYPSLNSNSSSLAKELRNTFGSFEHGAQFRYGSPLMFSLSDDLQSVVYRTSSVNSAFLSKVDDSPPKSDELKLDLSLSL